MRKEMSELSDIMKDKTEQEIVDLEAIDRANENRIKIYRFNDLILRYLQDNEITIDQLNKEDIETMTRDMTERDKYILIKQVVKAIETNYWKPIQWIKENHKCVLFD